MADLARARVIIVGDTAALKASLTSAEQHMVAAGKRMQKIGRSLTTKVSLPILGIGAVATRSAAKFDEQMRKMAGLVGVPREQLNAWRGDIRKLGVDFGQSGQEAAEAMFYITSASLRGDRAMEALRASLKGAAIGLGQTKTVADAATSAMNAYAKTGLTATRATEILAAGVRKGKLEAESLAPVIGRLTGTASALGISFEDVIATLATFSLTGFDATLGATSLVSIMSTLLGTSEEGEKLLRGAGISLEYLRDVITEPRGLLKALRMIDDAFEGNISQLETVIPNVRAIRGVLAALAQDASIVDNVFNEVTNSQGILDDALREAMGPMLRMQIAWAQIKDAMIELGDALIPIVVPAIKSFANAFHDVAMTFGNMPASIRQTTIVILGLAAALGPVLMIAGAVTAAIGVIGGTAALAIAAIGAIIAGGTALIQHWEYLRDVAIGVWDSITHGFKTIAKTAVDVGRSIGSAAADAAHGLASIGQSADEGLSDVGDVAETEMARIDEAAASTRANVTYEMALLWTSLKVLFYDGVLFIVGLLAKIPGQTKRIAEKWRDELAATFDESIAKNASILAEAEERVATQQLAGQKTAGDYRGEMDRLRQSYLAGETTRADYVRGMYKLNDAMLAASKTPDAFKRELDILQARLKQGTIDQQQFTEQVRAAASARSAAMADAAARAAAEAATKPKPPEKWEEPAATATSELESTLQQIANAEMILGDQFDDTRAKAEAYEKAFNALNASGALVDTTTGNVRAQFADLVATYLEMRGAVAAADLEQQKFQSQLSLAESAVQAAQGPVAQYRETMNALFAVFQAGQMPIENYVLAIQHLAATHPDVIAKQQKLNEQFNIAKSVVAAAQTPQEKYAETMNALNTAYREGEITQGQFVAGVRYATDELTKMKQPTDQLKQGLVDLAGRATDAFVDFAFNAGQSFSEFVRQAIIDLAKLIAKMQLMKMLFPAGGGAGGILGLARGGFIEPGGIAVAGERGPELVTEGQRPVRLPAPAVMVDRVAASLGKTNDALEQPINVPIAGKPQMGPIVPLTLSETIAMAMGGGQYQIVGGDTGAELLAAGSKGLTVTPIDPRTLPFTIPGYARGGYAEPGEVAVVGERGPELMSVGRRGVTITPIKNDARDAIVGTSNQNDARIGITQPDEPIMVPAYARGGYAEAGEVALVGERGPELVTTGRRGVSVTPAPAMGAALEGGGHGDTIPLTFNINAIDSRDVLRFLRDNEVAIGAAVTRAVSRSASMRKQIGEK